MKGRSHLPTGSGVYCIRHIGSGRVYIGSSVRMRKRAQEHVRELRRDGHANRYLQRTWNTYGPEQFEIFVLEVCEVAAVRAAERKHIFSMNSADQRFGFNMVTATPEKFGHSDQTRAKLSEILIGHKRNVGRPLSEEHKAKISAAQKGRKKSAEQIEKVASKLRGRKCTPEAIAKRSAALKGLPKSEHWLAMVRRPATPQAVAARMAGKMRAKAAREITGKSA